MYIKKRDGSIVEFNPNKISIAIGKAYEDVGGKIIDVGGYELTRDEVLYEINQIVNDATVYATSFMDIDPITVEQVQDFVELHLMSHKLFAIAKAYIRYRYKREVARNHTHEFIDALEDKIEAKNVQNQNANVDEMSFGGRVGEASDFIMKKYALEHCVSDKLRYNHENNRIYTHDLSAYAVGSHNCLTVPFDDLLKTGFNTRQTDVRPANSVNTAFQLLAVIFQLQSLQQFGGVAASHLDWTMVPYVRKSFCKHLKKGLKWIDKKDKIFIDTLDWEAYKETPITSDVFKQFEAYDYAIESVEKEVYQAVEGMYHNLNTLQSRSGNQLPFTSINYGTCTLPEGRMIINAILNVSIEGLGRLRKTSIFPCGIFQIGAGINKNPGDPNYDLFRLALKSTAKRLYPNYANIDWSGNAGYDKNDPRTYFATMGCRTANGWDINGFGQLKDGRGNIAPATIIMPTIAMEVYEKYKLTEDSPMKETYMVEAFMRALEDAIEDCKDHLIERFEYIAKQPKESAKFMYENGLMAGYDGKDIRSALQHGTLAVGQIGLAETLQILIGCDHTEEKGMELAMRIEQLFKDKCAKYKEEYKLNFGVYYTPAENMCYTSMTAFKKKYGEIPNVSDKSFFTNSIHVPVWKEMSPFRKIDIESKLTGYSSAGCITYVELDGSVAGNIDALEKIVIYAMNKDIPYLAINVPNDMCTECGFTDEIDDICPMCGHDEIRRLRRVTGYLTGDYLTAFNKGKQDEVKLRVKHQ